MVSSLGTHQTHVKGGFVNRLLYKNVCNNTGLLVGLANGVLSLLTLSVMKVTAHVIR